MPCPVVLMRLVLHVLMLDHQLNSVVALMAYNGTTILYLGLETQQGVAQAIVLLLLAVATQLVEEVFASSMLQ